MVELKAAICTVYKLSSQRKQKSQTHTFCCASNVLVGVVCQSSWIDFNSLAR